VEVPATIVLIVNDHAAARETLGAQLEEEGFAVMAYASAAQCLADCDFRHVACAVVSHDMQEMTGFELAKAFQSGWLAIPTILLADTPPAGLQDPAAAGVIAVFGLSPDLDTLCALLRETLAVSSQATG
jgi:DNA-binding NtrC family response regulator